MNNHSAQEGAAERPLSQDHVVARLQACWGPATLSHDVPYWVGADGDCVVACVLRFELPVLRVSSEGPPLVRFIEVGDERGLGCALELLEDFRPCDAAVAPAAALSLELWECTFVDSWSRARAARRESADLRAWSRALHATAAIAARVSAGLLSGFERIASARPVRSGKGRRAG